MTLKHVIIFSLAGFIAISAFAGASSPNDPPAPAPDKEKLSYAVGTRMGLQLSTVKSHIDSAVAIQAIQDVFDGKGTMVDEADLGKILNMGISTNAPDAADQRKKFSYAGGMRSALMFKRTGFDLDTKAICQAIQDQLDGKPKMSEAETMKMFKEAAAYAKTKKAIDDTAAGKAFLEKNAKLPGIHVLPDGLQYQVIKEGTGPLATTNDLIYIKYRGTLINNQEFYHHNHYLTRIYGGVPAWKEVLPQMKVGSEWKLFVPTELGFGTNGNPVRGIGPGMALIYDLELLSIAPPGGNYQINSRMGHGADIDQDDNSPQAKPQ